MSFEELRAELGKLINQKVIVKRIAADSIIIYFFGEPGDKAVRSIWMDPAWRYERNGRVILGSRDLSMRQRDFPSREEAEKEFHRLCDLCQPLFGSTLLKLKLDLVSSDLTLEFSEHQALRNFADSGYDDVVWTYRNAPMNLAAEVSPGGIKVRTEASE